MYEKSIRIPSGPHQNYQNMSCEQSRPCQELFRPPFLRKWRISWITTICDGFLLLNWTKMGFFNSVFDVKNIAHVKIVFSDHYQPLISRKISGFVHFSASKSGTSVTIIFIDLDLQMGFSSFSGRKQLWKAMKSLPQAKIVFLDHYQPLISQKISAFAHSSASNRSTSATVGI